MPLWACLPSLDGYAYPFPPIPISATYDIAFKGRGHQRRHRQRAPIDSHKDRYVCCVVTSGSVSQMRGQLQSQTALGAVLKGLLGVLEQCRHITAPVGCRKIFLARVDVHGSFVGIHPALQSSRLGRAKLGDRGGVAPRDRGINILRQGHLAGRSGDQVFADTPHGA